MRSGEIAHLRPAGGRRRAFLVAAAVVGAIAMATSTAGPAPAASEGSRQTASLEFTTKQPGSPAGALLAIDYVSPDDPDAKPPAVRRVVTTLAPGARYDTSVPARCKASDAELVARGEAACPRASMVGVGSLTIDTGFPGPNRFVDVGVDFFNNTDELIFLNTERDSGARTVLRAPIRGRRIVSEVPPLPGTPPEGGAITATRFRDFGIVERGGAERRGYITTPRRCPDSGQWTNRIAFTYSDRITQTVESRSPCNPAPACGGRQATLVSRRADDVLRGTPGRDVIVARRGDDTVRGRGGDDLVCGRRGADEVRGGRGRDRLYLGRGDDQVGGGEGRDRLRGGRGADDLRGGGGRDRCRGGGGRDQKRSCER